MGDIPLYKASVSKEDFLKAMQEFSDSGASGAKSNFDSHFLSRASDIYDWGEKYGINPELIVVFAWAEQSFKDPVGDESNFWGLATPNGASSPSYGSFENGMKAMAEKFQQYNAGSGTWHEGAIRERATQRQGNDSDGYGEPGTLRGLLSLYTDLLPDKDPHCEGDAGGYGGRAYLREIYGSEYDAKCGSVHSQGNPWTIEEETDASAYVYRQRRKMWETIFGKYATIGGNGDILQVAEQCWKWVCENNPSYGGCSIPPTSTIDCSGYVTWVLYSMGYTEFSYQWTTQTFIDNQETLKSKYGWEIIPISSGQDISDIVQPGDIIDRATGDGGSGHMNIAVSCDGGKLMAYDCGSEKNWRERSQGGSPIDRSYFLTSDGYGGPGKPGIIIRGVKKP